MPEEECSFWLAALSDDGKDIKNPDDVWVNAE